MRLSRIRRYHREALKVAAAQVGLAVHEYETLHALMIRDTPGTASPASWPRCSTSHPPA